MESVEERERNWKINCLPLEIKQFSPIIQKFHLKNYGYNFKLEEIQSVYLSGKPGIGKTITAVLLALQELQYNYIFRKGNKKVELINSIELLQKFKISYTKAIEDTETDILDFYSNIHLLILDDFGVEKTTDWSFQMLYLLITRRHENLRKTIFTSNFTLTELAEKLGDDRIPSRIQEMCEVIHMTGKNYRTEK
jgi:DNA replication protein DnaC